MLLGYTHQVLPDHQLKKTEVMGQDVAPEIKIGDHTLGVTDSFTYLSSTIFNNLSLQAEINI